MALPSKLFRFKIELSDLVKSSYQSLDFRIAQHPSESLLFLLTRVFAYALSYDQELEFSTEGLSNPDAPCLQQKAGNGGIKLWIEIGSPSVRKIHKASKASEKLRIFTYKDPLFLINEMAQESIHRKSEIELFSISPEFLKRIESKIKKENKWSVIYMEDTMMVNGDDLAESCEIKRHQIK